MSFWNYRVLKDEITYNKTGETLERFRVIEVYYDDNGNIKGWCDCTESILCIVEQPYEDLKETAQHVTKAFELPILEKDENDKLYEIK